MIKIVAVAAGAALTIAALAGCSQPSNSNANSNSAPAANTAPSNAAPAENTASSNAAPTSASGTSERAPQQSTQTTGEQNYIGEQVAKEAALAAAGFSEEAVSGLKAELDYDAPVHYDVDFKSNGQEYDYDIDATTGAVISGHSEVD